MIIRLLLCILGGSDWILSVAITGCSWMLRIIMMSVVSWRARGKRSYSSQAGSSESMFEKVPDICYVTPVI